MKTINDYLKENAPTIPNATRQYLKDTFRVVNNYPIYNDEEEEDEEESIPKKVKIIGFCSQNSARKICYFKDKKELCTKYPCNHPNLIYIEVKEDGKPINT